MKNFRFSEEEKKIILEGFELVIMDIEKLWDKAKTATDEVYTYIFEYEDFCDKEFTAREVTDEDISLYESIEDGDDE